jgi:hypothetical protein
MPPKKKEGDTISPPQKTRDEEKLKGEASREQMPVDPDRLAAMSDEDIVDISRQYKLSAPLRIPTHLLNQEFDYRWIGTSPKQYRKRLGVGWTPVMKKELEERLSKVPLSDLHMGTHFSPDGRLCLGMDLVFAFRPKRIGKALREADERRKREAVDSGKRQFHEAGQLTGVGTFEKFPGEG